MRLNAIMAQVPEDHVTPTEHRTTEARRRAVQRWRELNRQSGRCINCGRPREHRLNRTLCFRCALDRATRAARLRANRILERRMRESAR